MNGQSRDTGITGHPRHRTKTTQKTKKMSNLFVLYANVEWHFPYMIYTLTPFPAGELCTLFHKSELAFCCKLYFSIPCLVDYKCIHILVHYKCIHILVHFYIINEVTHINTWLSVSHKITGHTISSRWCHTIVINR
jgi:hypothetical protein